MITITQSKNTHEVINHFKPEVAVTWVTTGARPLDAFSRDIMDKFYQFQGAMYNMPNTSRNPTHLRLSEGTAGYVKDDRIYIAAAIARSTPLNSTINPRAVEHLLNEIGDAMRKDNLYTIVIPNISTGRNPGIRTSTFLDIIDRTLGDMQVYIATAVPLDSHGRGYVDITTSYQGEQDPSLRPRKKIIRHNMTHQNYPQGYASDFSDLSLFHTPIKASYL